MTTEFAISRESREEVATWLDANLPPVSANLNRYLLQSGRVIMPTDDHAVAFRLTFPSDIPAPTFGSTTPRLSLYSRNSVSYLAARSWTQASKAADLAALKLAKLTCAAAVIDLASSDIVEAIAKAHGRPKATAVTTVPCGHSKRPDCFALQVAIAVASKLGLEFRQVFEHRFVTGSSHPKEFKKLPPLIVRESPPEPSVIVVDDVATSGWHMEEALLRLRADGYGCFGAVWLGGTVSG